MGDENTLRNVRNHIVIVGKFSVAGEKDRIVTTDFRSAFEKLDFSFYATTEEGAKINDVPMRCSIPKTASNLTESEQANILAGKKDAPAKIELSRTTLGAALRSGNLSSAEIGGRLYIDVLDALDRIMPFWHPNFDTLLCEAFVEFYGQLDRSGHFVGRTALRDFVLFPEVNTRLLAFLRGDASQAAEYIESIRNAALRAAEYAEFRFSLGGASDADGYLSQIIDDLQRFRRALEFDRDSSEKDVQDVRRLKQLDKRATVGELCRSLLVPGYPAVVSASLHLQDMFRAFHKGRKVVENSAASEPVMALMVAWALSKLGRNGSEQAAVLQAKFYTKAASQAIPLSRWEELGEEFIKTVKDGLGGAELSENQRKVAGPVLERGVKNWYENAGVVRVYTSAALIRDVVELFKRVVGRLTPGGKDCAVENERMIRDICDVLRDFRYVRDSGLTVDVLRKRYAGKGERWNAWLEKFCAERAERAELRGAKLAEEFEMGSVRDYAALTFVERTVEFLEREKKGIDMRLENAERTLARFLREDANSSVAQAPAGGTAVGVVTTVSGHGATASTEDAERRKKRFRQRRASRASADAASEGHEAAGASDRDSGPDRGADEAGASDGVGGTNRGPGGGAESEPAPENEGGTVRLFREEETRPEEPELAEDEQVTAEQNLEMFRRLLFEELDLLGDDEQAELRAEVRALLYGEYMLRTKQSPLGEKDGSIGAHLLWRLTQMVGVGTERARGEERERLKSATVDLECGITKVEMDKIVQVDPGDVSGDLNRFAEYWNNCAESIKSLSQDIEELADMEALMEDLANSGVDGTVTIVNETIAEHALRNPKEQRLIASDKSVVPPGLVYVTRQAQKGRDSQKVISLGCLAKSLFVHKDAPFERSGTGNLTRLQRLLSPEHRRWSLPMFVGRSLENVVNDGEKCLPVVALETPEISAAVVFLTGLVPGTPRWRNAGGIDRRGVEAFEELLSEVHHSAGELGISEGCSLWKAWREVLLLPDFLGAQCLSKIVSHALHQRLSGEGPKRNKPKIEAAFYPMLTDLAEIYAGDGLKQRDVRLQLLGRIRIGDNAVPEHETGKLDSEELSVEGRKTATGYMFRLV